jgi:nucleoside-diphosphate-sugar epimerase
LQARRWACEHPGAILITGSTGYLGSLVVATALRETAAVLVLPVRAPHTRDTVVTRIAAEAVAEGYPLTDADVARLVVVALPLNERLDELRPTLAALGVREIIHCAGCLSYFNVERLQSGNVDLTRAMVALGARLEVRRFVFLSTAYSSGFVEGPIGESLHDGPRTDPTDYTRTKREAEWVVAQSPVPSLIVRPSIVIGDSRDGRYTGKPYGPYQLWLAVEKYLPDGFPRVLHVVAAEQPVNFLHQDAFTAGFWAAYHTLPDGSVVHLASREEGLPSMRDLWRLWLSTYGGPEEVHLYERLADVPRAGIDPQLRLWLDFTAVNSEIASMRWHFVLDTLDHLRRMGTGFVDATVETMQIVQDRCVRESAGLQRFVQRHAGNGAPCFVAHPGER